MKASFVYLGVSLAAFLLLALNVPRVEAATTTTTTTVITPGTSAFPSTVQQGDTLVIEKGATAHLSLTNYGTVINRGTVSGAIANQESGKIVNEQGAMMTGTLVDNHGIFENRGEYSGPQTRESFVNHETGRVDNYGHFDAHTLNVVNRGHFGVMEGGTFVIFNGVAFTNDGGTVANSGTFRLSKTTDFLNVNSGSVANNAGGQFFSGGYGTGSGTEFRNDDGGSVANAGTFTNHDFFFNDGTFSNTGTLYNRPSGLISPLFANAGTLDNSGNMHNLDDSDAAVTVTVRNSGTLNNFGSMSNRGPDAAIVNECGATFNNSGAFAGNPVEDACASSSSSPSSSFPIVHMPAPTASAGYGVHAIKPARIEHVTEASQLVGDQVDSLSLRLKKVGDISGTAEVGVFNADLSVKKLFGKLDVSTALTTSYADKEFKLASGELYTIEAGDRIGIKYSGGDAAKWVSAMLDLDPASPFDGAASHHQHYQSGTWQSNADRDLYMELQQTHG
jgi:hypothetical protein